jgi:2-dehydropantoate 2-reductase
MLLDHLAQRRSEVDAINGSIPPLGAKYAIPTPMNETLVSIIRAREAHFTEDPVRTPEFQARPAPAEALLD